MLQAYDKIQALIVGDQINKLPDPITLDDKAAVTAAVTAFAELTEKQSKLVPEDAVKKLKEAETTIANLQFAADKKTATGMTVKIGKVKNLKGKKARVTWSKAKTTVTGFHIQYSVKKNFKKKVKTRIINKPTAGMATIGKLKKGKSYYFRVRTYTKVTNSVTGESVTIKSKWSAGKKVKIKK